MTITRERHHLPGLEDAAFPSLAPATDLTVNFLIGMTGMLAALAVGWLVFGVTPSGNLAAVLPPVPLSHPSRRSRPR